MASLLQSFTESLTSDALGALGRAAGVDTAKAQQAMGIVAPLLLGSLARKSQTTSGMDAIMKLLPEETQSSALGKLFGLPSGPNPIESASMLSGMLGPGVSSVAKLLSGRLGFEALPLLASAGPALLGFISGKAKEQKLNSVDLASVLQKDSAAALASASPETRSVIDEAMKVSHQAEALKARFTDDEWRRIRLAPLGATMYVVSASPSGIAGLAKEVTAAGTAMQGIVKDALPTSLVDVAYGSMPTGAELEGGAVDKDAPRASMLNALQAAAAAVREKSPADARSFGETLVTLSRHVAEASKEGGFLGIGGTRVSKDEEQAIAEIAAALLPAASA